MIWAERAGTAAGAATTGQMSRDLDRLMPAIGGGNDPWRTNIPYTPAPSSGIDPYSQPGATIGTHDAPPSWLGGTGGASGIQTPTSVPGSYTNQIWDMLRGGAPAAPAPTGTLSGADALAPFSAQSYSRTVSPTSVPGSYQPSGYLGGQDDVSGALPTLSPTSQPGFYNPPSIMSGTGGANRGTEPDLYGGVFTPGDLGLGGPSPAAAAPAAPASTFPGRPESPGTGFPAARGNPFAGPLGDIFGAPSRENIDLFAGGTGVAPPVSSSLPGFLEAGGTSYATPQLPQPRPTAGPPDSYKFLGNMPQARPDPFSPDYQPYTQRGSGWSPYEEGFTPPLPRARPEYINPFGYYFGE